jgi:integrase
MSELCGLTWADVRLDDMDDAELTFGWQVDRKGERRPTKTGGSARAVPIPRELAVLLARHKLASRGAEPSAFVFATRSGRALGQRNVQRALRKAQERAADEHGRPTFPILHETDNDGEPVKVPAGARAPLIRKRSQVRVLDRPLTKALLTEDSCLQRVGCKTAGGQLIGQQPAARRTVAECPTVALTGE